MPVYAYKCKNCNHQFDLRQSFSDEPIKVCPECGGEVRKQFNSVGVVFKGSGFYRNDSRTGAGKGSGDTKGRGKTSETSDSTTSSSSNSSSASSTSSGDASGSSGSANSSSSSASSSSTSSTASSGSTPSR